MARLTENLELTKPELSDNITPTIFADNFDKIDEAMVTHTHAASKISAGTFAGKVVAQSGTDYTTNRIRNTVFTTTDPGAGSSTSYTNGSIIAVYEN